MEVWDSVGGERLCALRPSEGSGSVDSLAIYDDGPGGRPLIAASFASGKLIIWDGDDFHELQTLELDGYSTCRLSSYNELINGQPRLVAGSTEGNVGVLDGRTGAIFRTLDEEFYGGISCVTCYLSPSEAGPQPRVVAGGWDGGVRVYDPERGVALCSLEDASRSRIWAVTCFEAAAPPHGVHIVSASKSSMVRVHDAESGALVGKFEERFKNVWSVTTYQVPVWWSVPSWWAGTLALTFLPFLPSTFHSIRSISFSLTLLLTARHCPCCIRRWMGRPAWRPGGSATQSP
jgi:WD40 repeat protein